MTNPGILLVDDEALALKYFAKAFAGQFRVFSANSAAAALETLAANAEDIAVIVTDQRMPEATGIDLLREVRRRYPRIVRILTTAYSDLNVLVEAINTGAVFSFVSKPWQLGDLERTLTQALERHEHEAEAQRLLATKLDEFRASMREGRTYDLAQIAARIGHHVHNALCPVQVLIDQIAGGSLPSPLSDDFVRGVSAQVQSVSRTLKDLAQISSPPARRLFRKVDLAAAANAALAGTEAIRAGKQLRCEVEIAEPSPTVHGDPAQLETLFRFMLAEETVSLPPGSTMILRIGPVSEGDHAGGSRIEVEDFEPLSRDALPEDLFQPFRPRGNNPRDFGIFLASSYVIAEHHDGKLDVRIKHDGGLIFSITFPPSHLPHSRKTSGTTNACDSGNIPFRP